MTSQTFTCPQCGAPQDPPATPATTVECPYCGHTVIVPEEMRLEPEPVSIQVGEPTTVVIDLSEGFPSAAPVVNKAGKWVTCVIILVLVTGLAAILVPLLIAPALLRAGTGLISTGLGQNVEATPGFATLGLSFGQQGVGAGMFEDARGIAVDGQGRIYVGEYQGGRVQVFDPQGQFLTQWMVNPDAPLVSLAAARDGTVYIVQHGEVLVYQGLSGALQSKFEYEDSLADIFITLDSGLLAATGGTDDDLLRFDSSGALKLAIPSAISGQTGDAELDMQVVEDGLGNMYALGSFNNAVFKYNAQGKYLDKIGSKGDQPGQLQATGDITVDGKGRVFVSDIKGIQAFDVEGRYLGLIEVEGFAFGLTSDDQNNLYVAAGDKVYKFNVP